LTCSQSENNHFYHGRTLPVAIDSTTSLTPNSLAACGAIAASMDDAHMQTKHTAATRRVQPARLNDDQFRGFMSCEVSSHATSMVRFESCPSGDMGFLVLEGVCSPGVSHTGPVVVVGFLNSALWSASCPRKLRSRRVFSPLVNLAVEDCAMWRNRLACSSDCIVFIQSCWK